MLRTVVKESQKSEGKQFRSNVQVDFTVHTVVLLLKQRAQKVFQEPLQNYEFATRRLVCTSWIPIGETERY